MDFFKFESQEAQNISLANKVAIILDNIIKQKGFATIAVSGGKSPINLFHHLSHKDIPWDKVTITLVDERFVPTDHLDSNENLVKKHLLINLAEQASFIGVVTTSDILSSTVNINLNIHTIDLAILGMGDDGHTASIFPCCDELDKIIDTDLTTEQYVISTPKTASHQRIGLSLHGILQIKNILVSISGEKKLAVFETSTNQISKLYPISYVIAKHKNTSVFWHP